MSDKQTDAKYDERIKFAKKYNWKSDREFQLAVIMLNDYVKTERDKQPASDTELEQKIFELTAKTGQKFMKTRVLEDWTLSKDIMSLVEAYTNKQMSEMLDRIEAMSKPLSAIENERKRLGGQL